jgi:hypothetical protein
LRELFHIGAVCTTTALNHRVSLQAPLRARRFAVCECAEGVCGVGGEFDALVLLVLSFSGRAGGTTAGAVMESTLVACRSSSHFMLAVGPLVGCCVARGWLMAVKKGDGRESG